MTTRPDFVVVALITTLTEQNQSLRRLKLDRFLGKVIVLAKP
jgi:hypothetical protein